MEGIASVWNYQESMDDLKHKLHYTTIELESTRMNAQEVMRKSEEYVKQLLDLLKVACQERDEAKDQLQRLLNNALPLGPTEICTVFPCVQPESPRLQPKMANSSVTESDSLSETFNRHSHGSSPVDSFIDAISSSELTNMNIADSSNTGVQHHPFVQECNKLIPMDILSAGNSGIVSKGSTEVDRASLVIDNLVKGKQLPQKGRLLQAVTEAGPLLQTLIVAGPLPQWRNPPPLQPLNIPPVSIKGCDPETINRAPDANPNYNVQTSFSSSYIDVSAQICTTSTLSVPSGSGSCLNKAQLCTGIGWDSLHNKILSNKRQRFQ